MEAEVKNNVTTKQTNHHRKEKKKCTKYEFSLEGKTVDSLISSHGFEVCHIEIIIALLKLKRRKKYLHTRMRFYSNSVATFQLEYLLSCGDIETNPGPTGGGNLCPTCQNTYGKSSIKSPPTPQISPLPLISPFLPLFRGRKLLSSPSLLSPPPTSPPLIILH